MWKDITNRGAWVYLWGGEGWMGLESAALSEMQNRVLMHKPSPAVLTTAAGRYHCPYFMAEEMEAQR